MDKPLTPQSYDFRHQEVAKLFDWARGGESASIIGVSGVGKSNLFNHLLDPDTQQRYLGELANEFIFIRVNFHYLPDYTNRSIYSLILEEFELLDGRSAQLNLNTDQLNQLSQFHDDLLNAGGDLLKVQRYFKRAMRLLLQSPNHRLVFLFDQFDDVYQEADGRFFANLRGLREAYKYRISYFAFTRSLLTALAETDPAREEFCELLLPNVLGLGPLNEKDAQRLLERIALRLHLPQPDELAGRLVHLAGGHGGLLRSVYLAVAQGRVVLPPADDTALVALLLLSNIETECAKIWASLRVEEQRLLTRLVHGATAVAGELRLLNELQLKGMITAPDIIFSPLFARFVTKQEALWDRPLHYDTHTRQVWALGQPSEPLTALEHQLFRLLYARLDELVDKEELFAAGWPEAKGGVSDQALTAVMYRLRRKIEPDPGQPRFLDSLRGQGYMLHAR